MEVVHTNDHSVNLVRSNTNTSTLKECKFCGRQHKFGKKELCYAFGKQCNKCGKYNHFASKCRDAASNFPSRAEKPVHCVQSDHDNIFSVEVFSIPDDSQFISLCLTTGCWIKFQLDTGAQCNVIPVHIYELATGDKKLEQVSLKKSYITAYGGTRIQVIGDVILFVLRNNMEYKIRCKLVDNCNVRPLLGRKACIGMNVIKYLDNDEIRPPAIGTAKVYSVEPPSCATEELLSQYSSVFTDGPGKMDGFYHI